MYADLYDSNCLKKKECDLYPHPPEDYFDQYISISGMNTSSGKLLPPVYTSNEESGIKNSHLSMDSCGFNRNQELPSVASSSTFLGMFLTVNA